VTFDCKYIDREKLIFSFQYFHSSKGVCDEGPLYEQIITNKIQKVFENLNFQRVVHA